MPLDLKHKLVWRSGKLNNAISCFLTYNIEHILNLCPQELQWISNKNETQLEEGTADVWNSFIDHSINVR